MASRSPSSEGAEIERFMDMTYMEALTQVEKQDKTHPPSSPHTPSSPHPPPSPHPPSSPSSPPQQIICRTHSCATLQPPTPQCVSDATLDPHTPQCVTPSPMIFPGVVQIPLPVSRNPTPRSESSDISPVYPETPEGHYNNLDNREDYVKGDCRLHSKRHAWKTNKDERIAKRDKKE